MFVRRRVVVLEGGSGVGRRVLFAPGMGVGRERGREALDI